METYKNLKKGTKIGLIITAVLCVAMLAMLSFTLVRGFAAPPPQNMPESEGVPNPNAFVIPGNVHVILDVVLFVAILLYAFFGYKKPHGDMLKILFFVFSVYLLAYACIDFMTKSSNYIGNSALALSALFVAYISGRLHKLNKNKILLLIVGVLLCVAEVTSFIDGPAHRFDFDSIQLMICQSTAIIAHVALGFAYTARYEQHKAAGLADKADAETNE